MLYAQMVEFIKQEANEKAHEILIKAGETLCPVSPTPLHPLTPPRHLSGYAPRSFHPVLP